MGQIANSCPKLFFSWLAVPGCARLHGSAAPALPLLLTVHDDIEREILPLVQEFNSHRKLNQLLIKAKTQKMIDMFVKAFDVKISERENFSILKTNSMTTRPCLLLI